ncbi:MAG: hypothetical protein IT323_06230 [Anaerolineae bacterium]|nr:hypothetical protein [Anaerolineae bacterium]
MNTDLVVGVIDLLTQIRARSSMYISSPSGCVDFLSGFRAACGICQVAPPGLDVQVSVTMSRGWTWAAVTPIVEMEQRGLNEREIIQELISIEIDAWQRLLKSK